VSVAVFEKFGTAVKEAVVKTGWAMQGYPAKEPDAPPAPITWTYADDAKPVQTWEEFTATAKGKGMIKVADMPPLVTVEPLLNRFVAATREVIAEAGDSHRCQPILRCSPSGMAVGMAYVHNGEGSCIVGKVLIKMGVSASDLARMEGNGADVVIRHFFGGDRQIGEVAALGNMIQMVNDSQQSWGNAKALLPAV
jgi:hypothetical protein